tara:strand:+ start:900 stop:1094 length:195 start_codon:yes stop_codon:yes gene_type:complete
MSENSSDLLEDWSELKVLVESLELDMLKHAKGNKSAGVRVRKGLRLLKQNASGLIKGSLAKSKE